MSVETYDFVCGFKCLEYIVLSHALSPCSVIKPAVPSVSYFQNHIILLYIINAPPFTNGNLVTAKVRPMFRVFGDNVHENTQSFILLDVLSPKTHTRVNFGKRRRKQRLHLFHKFLSFLTTSARSSMPFLEVANSLLGRMESRTVWRGRFDSGASMSPMAEERQFRRSSGLNSTGKKR